VISSHNQHDKVAHYQNVRLIAADMRRVAGKA
jgi:hypothetical protein